MKVPSFLLPPSGYAEPGDCGVHEVASSDGRETGALQGSTIEEVRASTERALSSRVEAMKARYPVTIEKATIAGVPVAHHSAPRSQSAAGGAYW